MKSFYDNTILNDKEGIAMGDLPQVSFGNYYA
jgi:hypothetical protein